MISKGVRDKIVLLDNMFGHLDVARLCREVHVSDGE